MANKTIQLLRNATLYTSHAAALSALQTKLGQSTFDGQPILARYKVGETGPEHTLLGIKSGGGYEIFDNEGTQSAAVTSVQYSDQTKKITYTKNGTQEDVVTLADVATSGAAGDVAIEDAGGIITATTVEGALQEIAAEINNMDKAASAENGKVVTTVSETDGVVEETKANVKDLQLGGYEKDARATGDIASTDTINAALSKLENKAAAITVASADGTVTVTSPVGGGTDLAVHIDGTTIVKDSSTGVLSADLTVTALTATEIAGLSDANVKEAYKLIYATDAGRTAIGEVVKIYKDSALQEVYLGSDQDTINPTTGVITKVTVTDPQSMNFAYQLANGTYSLTKIDVSKFLTDSEFADGLQVSGAGVVSVKKDAASGKVRIAAEPAEGEDTGLVDVLTVSSNGVKVDNIQAAIDYKVSTLDATDTAVAGQYVSAVTEADGVITVSRTDVSGAVLNNYAKGTDATAVAATDTVNDAISKLENQVDKAKSAATTVVAEGTDAGNNMSIAETAGADGHKIFTINLTDVASDTALTAEIAARKAVDGQNGDTYTANTGVNYIGNATSLNDADVKLDAALKVADDAMLTGVAAGNGISVAAKANKSQTITAVAATNDPIIEVTASGIATKENAIFDAGTY